MLFLAVVALWRVALYWRFLRGPAGLPGLSAFIAMLLPLALIVVALSLFNLEHAVFDVMAGISRDRQTSADAAYVVVIVLSVFSTIAAPLVGIIYLGLILKRWRGPLAENPGAKSGQRQADRPD
jgi:hypothetical protein